MFIYFCLTCNFSQTGKWENREIGETWKNEKNRELGFGIEIPLSKIAHSHFPQMGNGWGWRKGLRSGNGDGGT